MTRPILAVHGSGPICRPYQGAGRKKGVGALASEDNSTTRIGSAIRKPCFGKFAVTLHSSIRPAAGLCSNGFEAGFSVPTEMDEVRPKGSVVRQVEAPAVILTE